MLPEKFQSRVIADLGEADGVALCAALETASPTSVRLNPFKTGAMLEGERVAWNESGMYLSERPQFTVDAAFHAGAYYVQEASSQFVGHIIAGEDVRGARVLDLCAAPGGKTTIYSSMVGTSGLVVANEVNRQRAAVLADNVRKWGVGNVAVTVNTPEQIASVGAWFDIVAVDAPCSGEGMFRKSEEARAEWSENNVKMCVARQTAIVSEAWKALKPGGIFIYSTCTFNRDENEGILEQIMEWVEDGTDDFGDIRCEPEWGISEGRCGDFRTFRFYPHKAKGEGFFVAVVRKSLSADGRGKVLCKPLRQVMEPVDKRAAAELGRWVSESESMRFALIGDTYYGYFKEQSEAVKQIAGMLNVIYSGVALGQIFKGVLKPDHALALFCGLRRDCLPNAYLSCEDVLKYLRKQELDASLFEIGINLVCCGGNALGFAKRIDSRVNNLYPNSLRILKNEF